MISFLYEQMMSFLHEYLFEILCFSWQGTIKTSYHMYMAYNHFRTEMSFLTNLQSLFLCCVTFPCQVFFMATLLFKAPPYLSTYSKK